MKRSLVLVFAVMACSMNVLAEGHLYSISAENLPSVGDEQTVYLGDKMMQQRFGYYVQCYTPREDLVFANRFYERQCLKASQRFEKKCCINGVRQIEKDGLLCPMGRKQGKHPLYQLTNFPSFRRKDGSEQKQMEWTLRENKKKKRWYQEPAGAKVVDLPKDEFDQIFTPQTIFNAQIVTLTADKKICKELGSSYFETDGAGDSIRKALLRDVSEIPADVSAYSPVGIVFGKKGNATEITAASEKISMPLQMRNNLTFDEALEGSSTYRIKNESMQQSIEYAGRTGKVLTFIYTEFNAGMARDAFTREFKIDQSEGNVGAFKGAVFEVLEATNSTITYKVIRHFPER